MGSVQTKTSEKEESERSSGLTMLIDDKIRNKSPKPSGTGAVAKSSQPDEQSSAPPPSGGSSDSNQPDVAGKTNNPPSDTSQSSRQSQSEQNPENAESAQQSQGEQNSNPTENTSSEAAKQGNDEQKSNPTGKTSSKQSQDEQNSNPTGDTSTTGQRGLRSGERVPTPVLFWQGAQPTDMENFRLDDTKKEIFRRGYDRLQDPFKVIVMGDPGVGKTSIIRRYTKREYSPEYQATVGLDLVTKNILFEDIIVKLHIWDIAGEERTRYVTRALFREVHGAIVVQDATKAHTYNQLLRWKYAMENCVTEPDGSKVPIFLLSNKVDLIEGKDRPCYENIEQELLLETGFTRWFETSAKENINIDLAFYRLIQVMVENRISNLNYEEDMERLRLSEEAAAAAHMCTC